MITYIYDCTYMITLIWLHIYASTCVLTCMWLHVYDYTYMITCTWFHVYDFTYMMHIYDHHICAFVLHVYDYTYMLKLDDHFESYMGHMRVFCTYMTLNTYMMHIYVHSDIWRTYMILFPVVMLIKHVWIMCGWVLNIVWTPEHVKVVKAYIITVI